MDTKTVIQKMGALSTWLAYLGAVALFAMMGLTAADVVGRYLFNSPIIGAYELTQFLVLILIFSFLGYTQASKAHVSVDLLVTRFPKKIQLVIELFNHTVSLVVMILITWMGIVKARELLEVGEISPNLGIPVYPFVFFLVFGCIVMSLEYLRDMIQLFFKRKEIGRS